MAILMGIAPSIFLKPMKPALDRVIARMAASEPSKVVSSAVSPHVRGAGN
jgi:hypothetical protein